MDPQLYDLICEGIAVGLCPIADDDDLRELLAVLEQLAGPRYGTVVTVATTWPCSGGPGYDVATNAGS